MRDGGIHCSSSGDLSPVPAPMQGGSQLLVPPALQLQRLLHSLLDSLDTAHMWNISIQTYTYTKTNLKKKKTFADDNIALMLESQQNLFVNTPTVDSSA